MTTLELQVCKNDKYFTEIIILIDHTDYVNAEMEEENIDRIKELLPIQHKTKLIISINKVTDVVIYKGVNSDKE
jgi:hypothetical protein